MTAATLSRLPMQAGGVVLASAGRAALWIIVRYMRSPLTHTAIAALVVTSALAGSNALYGQRHMHPAPLFSPTEMIDRNVHPVVPAVRHKTAEAKPMAKLVQADSQGLVGDDSGPIGNKDVFEVQRKLEMLKLFTGTIDGYYGPQTARAIKKFEDMQGLKQTGMLTRAIMDMIATAPLSAPEVKQPVVVAPPVLPKLEAAPAVVLEPASAPVIVAPKLKSLTLAALPEPKPLTMDIETGSIGKSIELKAAEIKPEPMTVLGRPVPATPQEALAMAADTAGDAIDTIISGVQTIAQTKPGKKPAAAIPFAAADKPMEMAAKQVEQVEDTTKLVAALSTATPGVPLKIEDEPADPRTEVAVLDTNATPEELAPTFSVTDPVIVAKVQRGLGSLGFLHGPADGVAGEATAKAIRNFEVYFNYKVTGRISPELLDLLLDNGAAI